MSLILHLSDLHLGSPSEWQLDHTDKFGLDRTAGANKIDHVRHALRALGENLEAQGRALDAIIVSGDLTNGNQPDGYQDFPALLDELGDCRPADDRIVVVPGNHDADWSVQPPDPAKFKRFLDAVRAKHRTPLFAGLDYDDNGHARGTGSRKKARPILELADASIVAISSADFSGVREERTETNWAALVASLHAGDDSDAATEERERAAEELRSLRVHDMARVDKDQLSLLRELIKKSSLASPADEDPRVRIAVLHHPILVVSDREEIKPFENLVNLDEVRSFLFDNEFHVVMHGHKHASFLGWDWLLPPSDDLSKTPRRALVLGAPGDFRVGETVCRLLEIGPDGDQPVPGAPRVRVIDVPGVRVSENQVLDMKVRPLALAQPFVGSADHETPWVVRAQDADAAYQQLRDLPGKIDSPRPVISVVENAASARHLPRNYPKPHDDEWLKDVVRWWQLPRPEAVRAAAGSDFNHGERLYAGRDAIEAAARALPSSKAIAILVDRDEAGDPKREYPALTAIQLQARALKSGTAVDAVGIYRKQDLRLWWPVNMLELAEVQNKAVAAAQSNKALQKPIVAGRLIAITSLGIHDKVLPQMAGTVLDRAIDLRPDWPHRLAYLAAKPLAATQDEWGEALADVGTQDEDKVLVPSIGLDRLITALEMHRELGQVPHGFAKLLTTVVSLRADAAAAEKALSDESDSTERDYWANKLQEDAVQVLAALKPVARHAGVAWR
jgi:3',5'-cyclic AMP phosphodiesterase CpdA